MDTFWGCIHTVFSILTHVLCGMLLHTGWHIICINELSRGLLMMGPAGTGLLNNCNSIRIYCIKMGVVEGIH